MIVLRAVLAVVALILVIAGVAGQGFGGGLLMAGVVALVVAALAGRTRLGMPLKGRTTVVVAVAGVVAVLAGGALADPTTPEAAPPAEPPSRSAPSTSAAPSEQEALPGTEAPGAPVPDEAPPSIEGPAPSTALAALATVEVKGRAPRTGYDRDNFGSGWVDTDRNGCDTRNDVLARDLTDETFTPGTRDCVVLTGNLADPYSGRGIAFQRGQDTSSDVQIDHVVALSDAWQKGAQQLDAGRRTAFANDPLNLLAVDGPLNMQKGDGDAATWLPPNRAFRCAYVARQVAVKVSYGLWMTEAEKNAIATVLGSCPYEPLPGGVVASAPAPALAPAPVPAPAPAPAPVDGTSFQNCTAARAAGAAPVHAGQPGYGRHLDRDGDGVGCE